MHFHTRLMAKLKYLVLHRRFEREVFPFPCPQYGYTWSLEKDARTYCIHIVCVGFLRMKK
jgi:hypothetical protein